MLSAWRFVVLSELRPETECVAVLERCLLLHVQPHVETNGSDYAILVAPLGCLATRGLRPRSAPNRDGLATGS